MATIFSKIINKEIPAYVVAEDADFIAFLDINPLNNGHTLVVPKLEVDYIFDLKPELLSKMICFAQNVAKAIDKCNWGKRVGVAVIGLEVPHAHIHLCPINNVNDMDFSKQKKSFTKEEFISIAEKIKSNL